MQGNDGTGNVIERDDWQTPQWLFELLDKEYNFVFDCCADIDNHKCHFYSDDFLNWNMKGDNVYWMNPPFTKVEAMFKQFFKIAERGVAIYRCDNMETKVWQEVILENANWIVIPKGRINYEGKTGKGSRFPSALIGIGLPPFEMENATTFKIVKRSSLSQKGTKTSTGDKE